ncbi:MAG: hypothetical protein KBT20_01395 [Bacteroidales bacterium]|nr:hypothetical protein [Candidatus Liminaster caballi]
MNTTTPTIGTITIEMDNPSVFRTVKTLLRQMKGISSVKVTQKPRAKMTEEEFYSMIDRSAATERKDGRNRQHPGESVSDYVNRLLQTQQ